MAKVTQNKPGQLLKGMKKTQVPADDRSTQIKGGSVDSDTTRKETARNQSSLGPRVA